MRIDVPAVTDQPEFVFDLEPRERPTERSSTDLGIRAAGSRMALYGVNVVRGEAQASAVPCTTGWDQVVYSVVTARLGFLPERGYRFVYARVEVSLGGTLRPDSLRPIAFSMLPASATDELKQTTTIQLTANLGLKVEPIEATLLKSDKATTVEVTAQRFRVVTFGECSSEPAWDFRTNEATLELAGDVALAFVAATPAGVAAQGAIVVHAEVESVRGIRISLFSKRPDLLSAAATFTLTEAK